MSEIRTKRPGVVVAAAVLMFVLGGYGLFGLCAVATPFLPDLMPQPPQVGEKKFEDPMKKLGREVPSFNLAQAAFGVAGFLLALVKIWAGVGLLNLQSSARKLAIAVSVATIVLTIGQSIYQAIFFIPAYTRILDEQVQNLGPMPPMPFDIFEIIKNSMWIMLFVGVLVSIAIWLTIIWLVNSKSARNAFAGISEAPFDEPESERRRGYDGYEDDDEPYPRSSPQAPGDTGIIERPG